MGQTRKASRTDAAELAAHLRPALLRLTRLVRSQRADSSVSLAQLSTLGVLSASGPLGPSELAARESVQPPTMTKVLTGLEERGLVDRETHPTDRRQAVISLTTAGRELVESERRSRTAWLSRRLATLTRDERAQLADVVVLLERLAEQ